MIEKDMNKDLYLGIDVGSISTNFVLMNKDRKVLFEVYERGRGNPISSIQQSLSQLEKNLPPGYTIKGVCTTGSGRILAGAIVGADIVKNEITAHARGAINLYPEVQTIFEIGGQDSKVTIIRDQAVVDFSMNLVCAAGTGSFLDSQARRLNISIEEFSNKAMTSTNPTDIAGRCTVFAESDMIHKQQVGHPQEDIAMGLCHSLVRNYLSNVCKGKDLKPPMVLQGGVSANSGICRAFQEALKCEIVVPSYNMVMGAYGAAIIAENADIETSLFRGCDVSSHSVRTKGFQCSDCTNYCEIIDIVDENKIIGRTGGRCRKWEGNSKPRDTIQGVDPIGEISDTTNNTKEGHNSCRNLDNVPDIIHIGSTT